MIRNSIKYFVYCISGTLLLIVSLTVAIPISPRLTFADASNACGLIGNFKATELVSTPDLTGNFKSSSGTCIVDPKAASLPFRIPGYDDLKSLYYDQSKATKSTISAVSSSTVFSRDHVYYSNTNLTVSGSPTGSGTQVIFINGNLTFSSTGNYSYGSATEGTVFVVKGDVNIDPTVTRIDAVIITSGTICTAYNGVSCPADQTAQQLVINGSLISLNGSNVIKFRRKLLNNSQPAEKINYQIKYLVILRNLISDTFQSWSEIQ